MAKPTINRKDSESSGQLHAKVEEILFQANRKSLLFLLFAYIALFCAILIGMLCRKELSVSLSDTLLLVDFSALMVAIGLSLLLKIKCGQQVCFYFVILGTQLCLLVYSISLNNVKLDKLYAIRSMYLFVLTCCYSFVIRFDNSLKEGLVMILLYFLVFIPLCYNTYQNAENETKEILYDVLNFCFCVAALISFKKNIWDIIQDYSLSWIRKEELDTRFRDMLNFFSFPILTFDIQTLKLITNSKFDNFQLKWAEKTFQTGRIQTIENKDSNQTNQIFQAEVILNTLDKSESPGNDVMKKHLKEQLLELRSKVLVGNERQLALEENLNRITDVLLFLRNFIHEKNSNDSPSEEEMKTERLLLRTHTPKKTLEESANLSEVVTSLILLEDDNLTSFTKLGVFTLDINDPKDDIQNSLELFEISVRKVKTTDGFVIEIFLEDIKQARKNEYENKELKMKSLVLAQVTHEFKTPLLVISHLLKERTNKDSQCRCNTVAYFKKENVCSDHLINLSNYVISLIQDISDYSKLGLGRDFDVFIDEFDLHKVIKFSFAILETLIACNDTKAGYIHPQLSIDSDVPKKIRSDEKRLKQVLLNLISNSVKFTNNGKIVLKVEMLKITKKSHPQSRYKNDKDISKIERYRKNFYIKTNSCISFTIEDTGIGISSEKSQQENLFQAHSKIQTLESSMLNKEGSGLGLSICRKIINKLGDDINCTSVLHKGSQFRFNLYNIVDDFEKNVKQWFSQRYRRESTTDENCEDFIELNELKVISEDAQSDIEESKSGNIDDIEEGKDMKEKDILCKNIRGSAYKNNSSSKTVNAFNEKIPFKTKKSKFSSQNTIEHDQLPKNEEDFYPKTYTQPQDIVINAEEGNEGYMVEDVLALSHRPFTMDRVERPNLNASWTIKTENCNRSFDSSNTIILNNVILKYSKEKENTNIWSANKPCNEQLISIVTYSFSINSCMKIFNPQVNRIFEFIKSIEGTSLALVLIVDDNSLIRKSLVNNIESVADSEKVKIIELIDGFDFIYTVYLDQMIGKRIRFVFADENMNLLNGTDAYTLLKRNERIDLSYFEFYITTCFTEEEKERITSLGIQILRKPVSKLVLSDLLGQYRL